MLIQPFFAHRRPTIQGWRALIVGLMATLFALSGVAHAAPPPNGTPPCHMTAQMADMGMMSPPGSPAKPPTKAPADMMAMNCCVGCLPTAVSPVVISEPAYLVRPIAFERRDVLRDGLVPSPELGPPRTA